RNDNLFVEQAAQIALDAPRRRRLMVIGGLHDTNGDVLAYDDGFIVFLIVAWRIGIVGDHQTGTWQCPRTMDGIGAIRSVRREPDLYGIIRPDPRQLPPRSVELVGKVQVEGDAGRQQRLPPRSLLQRLDQFYSEPRHRLRSGIREMLVIDTARRSADGN